MKNLFAECAVMCMKGKKLRKSVLSAALRKINSTN